MGLLSQSMHSIADAYVVPLVGYLFVAFYAFIGRRIVPSRIATPSTPNPALSDHLPWIRHMKAASGLEIGDERTFWGSGDSSGGPRSVL